MTFGEKIQIGDNKTKEKTAVTLHLDEWELTINEDKFIRLIYSTPQHLKSLRCPTGGKHFLTDLLKQIGRSVLGINLRDKWQWPTNKV